MADVPPDAFIRVSLVTFRLRLWTRRSSWIKRLAILEYPVQSQQVGRTDQREWNSPDPGMPAETRQSCHLHGPPALDKLALLTYPWVDYAAS